MNLLSHEAETQLVTGTLERVDRYLEEREKLPQHHTELISQQELKEELKLSFQTLATWEQAGLRRYQPPLEDSRKVFYRITDILVFLGVE
ncbi:TPA: XRE family transcriptional regulator [Streptococcus equi subsp. zooepidemicus]|uniref:Phage protein n=1 Tax=Streptococcus equi subsp. ruminatorum CECT 5772 TaxID=1051981 RepID=A0A922NVB2_9STRE|nr:hypothetical protein [Streptococcus equi]KED04671.1 hypothetical protein CECT5772_03966 [Streptococcus equi subsp. ruminatorum CECT 5772]HEL0246931.1 XRE family transcriptional regulator [Streptococcus equi subsp. zooepidemicus]HEL1012184.1 XRE family transcriptional regulator [Streptococcus equi subsp. ruminatorum]HEL1023931.1 XRE family transcriptional regulator [Streptococcus equi subsp. ruminatorum CECT 5772]